MNKEQILGRLLINGSITIDELNILNDTKKSIEDVVKELSKNIEKEKEFDWLDKFRKQNYYLKQRPIQKENNIYTSNHNSPYIVHFLNNIINGR